ncbi:MAG: histidine phosphatase family protein [Alphaproteobacteria bacterium]|nr:histidine phosphatase family protein [Alphaproteobacteria bacterium]
MRDFLFLRHGETDWNVANRMQGQIQDIPLNDTGRRQAEDAASFLARQSFGLIVSSTLDRAAVTARIIAERTGTPLVFDKRLIERSWGVAEGLTYDEFTAADPATFFTSDGRQDWIAKARQPKGSETREELADRASAALFDLLSRHQEQRLLLVTHGAWLRALAYLLTGIDQIFPNATPYIAREEESGWQINPMVC